MVGIGLFWLSLFAIIFFIIEMLFKAIASFFEGLGDAMEALLPVTVYSAIVAAGFYAIYFIIQGVRTSGVFLTAVALIIIMFVMYIAVYTVGVAGFLALEILIYVLAGLAIISEWGSILAENIYYFFVEKIHSVIEKQR